jgi:TRAP-type C4-dicarboxylate transport system substrate-binding protein
MSPTNYMLKQAVEFAEKVKEETDGRLEIIVRAGGTAI